MDVACRKGDISRSDSGARGVMIGFPVSVGHRVRRLVGGLAGSVHGDRWLVSRLGDLAGGWDFDRLGNLDHDRRVDHLSRWAVADLRSIAGVREVRWDRVDAEDRNVRDRTSSVVGTLARNVIVTGRLSIAGCGLGADDFVGGGGDSHRLGGV